MNHVNIQTQTNRSVDHHLSDIIDWDQLGDKTLSELSWFVQYSTSIASF